jgi:hypothetical protein
MKKGAKNDEELYHNYWSSKWKCNNVDPKQCIDISYITFSFLVRNNTIINYHVSISATHAFKAKTNLDATNNNSFAL